LSWQWQRDSFDVIIAPQHAMHAERDTVMANPSVDIRQLDRQSVRLSDCL